MEDKMIERITLEPYDDWDVATCTVFNDIVEIGHFSGVSDDKGHVLESVKDQTIRTFRNLEAALTKLDLNLDDLLKVTVILKDISGFQAMHQGWLTVFNESNYPTRLTITSDFVNANCLVQIAAVAARSKR